MEMEREIEWKTTEEEEQAAAAEEFGSGLKIRQRTRGKMGRENNEEKVVVNGEENGSSVFFEEDQGVWKCRHCTWTYHLSGPGIYLIQKHKHEGNCQVTMDVETLTQLGTFIDSPIKGAANVTAGLKLLADEFVAEKNLGDGIAGDEECNGDNNVPIEEQKVNLNGSSSHLSSEKKSENVISRNENEIQELEQHKPGEPSDPIVPEFDVEKVLEEQETHDLYCPNCHSCITKRVILRKRKRIPRETQSDLPPQKVPHVPEPSPALTETVDLHEDRTVFRCLSCFSFFIPTETGFNIFRCFGKEAESNDLQSREKKPAKRGNWISSLFGSGSSNNEGTEAKIKTDSRDSSESMPGAANLGEKGTTIGPSTGEFNSSGGLMGNHAQEGKQNYPATILENLSSGESHSNGSAMGSQAKENRQSYPETALSKDLSAGESHSNGSAIGNQAKENRQSYPETTPSKDPPAQGSYSNGLMDNQAHGDQQFYPAATLSEENGTKKPGAVVKPPYHEQTSQLAENISSYIPPAAGYIPPGKVHTSPIVTGVGNQNVRGPMIPPADETRLDLGVQGIERSRRENEWDILKSIVYGGLMESITSLSVVSSAAGAGSSTLNICALGLANLIGGLLLIAHDLSELRSASDAEETNQSDEQIGRYWEKLGKREHFRRHAVFAILSYIIFGLLPPVIYGFAFRKSDNKEYKLIAVAASSLLCVAMLAIGKAHVRPQKDYIKLILYYLAIAVPASGLSYVAGVMIDRLLVELGLFIPNMTPPSPPSSVELLGFGSGSSSWASL
ncbi:membrane protein of ER body-like protein isoform X2 [Asparagus officinalis]|uniref:membrane protein of ER body-like protein isoform X2 n=1 Tax=Asparagus officinalis TaxID=4686 RepID=UPI00098E1510|nr:membrane protein of ER body-like protein isoform X2 [Asparagus officinalis]